MLRWIVGVGRQQRQSTEQEGATGSEEEEEPEPLDEEEGRKDEPVELEDWVEFVRQTTGIAEEQLAKTRLEDWVAGQRRRKWRWAGHVARRKDHRWSNRILHWNVFDGRRRVGHPKRRWKDVIETFVDMHTAHSGREWVNLAQNQKAWKALGDKFVKCCHNGRH